MSKFHVLNDEIEIKNEAPKNQECKPKEGFMYEIFSPDIISTTNIIRSPNKKVIDKHLSDNGNLCIQFSRQSQPLKKSDIITITWPAEHFRGFAHDRRYSIKKLKNVENGLGTVILERIEA